MLHYSSGPITILRTLWCWREDREDTGLHTFRAPIDTMLRNRPRSQGWAILSGLISDLWHLRRLQTTPLQRAPTAFPDPHVHRLWLNGTNGRCSFSIQIFMELNPGSKRGIHTVPPPRNEHDTKSPAASRVLMDSKNRKSPLSPRYGCFLRIRGLNASYHSLKHFFQQSK